MDGFEVKLSHDFIEEISKLPPNVAELEQQLLRHCTQLVEKNKELRERNRELLQSAERGIEADAEFKKMNMMIQDLMEETHQLQEEIADLKHNIKEAQEARVRLQQEAEKQQQVWTRREIELRSQLDNQRKDTVPLKQLEQIKATYETKVATNENEFKREIESLRREIALEKVGHWEEVEELKIQFTAQVSDLEKQLASLLQESEAIKASYEAQIAANEKEFQQGLDALNQKLAQEKNANREQIEELNLIFATQISEFAEMSERRESIINKLQSEISNKSQQIDRLNAELSSAELNTKEIQAKFDQQLTELARSSFIAETKISQVGQELEASQRSAQAIKSEIADKDQQIRILSQEANSLKLMVTDLEKSINAFKIEIGIQRTTIRQNADQISDLTKIGQERDKELQGARAAFAHAQTEIQKLREVNEMQMQLTTTHLNAKIDEKQRHLIDLTNENESLKQKLNAATRSLQESEAERESLSSSFKALSNREDSKREQLESLASQLKNRESQLRHYAANIAKEKNDIIQCARQLADEIHSARTLNPLKDYLSLTEFELSKAELQLKKTPTISLERTRLESVLTQLHEQREFLKKTIMKSKIQLDEQAANLLRITRSQKAGTIPPLPPWSRDLDPES